MRFLSEKYIISENIKKIICKNQHHSSIKCKRCSIKCCLRCKLKMKECPQCKFQNDFYGMKN